MYYRLSVEKLSITAMALLRGYVYRGKRADQLLIVHDFPMIVAYGTEKRSI